mgnify:CR=1 FL=1
MKYFNDFYWERAYFDMWTIPHIFFGVILGALAYKLGLKFKTGMWITIILAILWEIFELIIVWEEAVSNRVTDILVAVIGYYIVWKILEKHPRDSKFNKSALIISLFIYSSFTILGMVGNFLK